MNFVLFILNKIKYSINDQREHRTDKYDRGFLGKKLKRLIIELFIAATILLCIVGMILLRNQARVFLQWSLVSNKKWWNRFNKCRWFVDIQKEPLKVIGTKWSNSSIRWTYVNHSYVVSMVTVLKDLQLFNSVQLNLALWVRCFIVIRLENQIFWNFTIFILGHDVIAQAQSGTGKTATFAISILQQLDVDCKDCQALILAPTRELAQQV